MRLALTRARARHLRLLARLFQVQGAVHRCISHGPLPVPLEFIHSPAASPGWLSAGSCAHECRTTACPFCSSRVRALRIHIALPNLGSYGWRVDRRPSFVWEGSLCPACLPQGRLEVVIREAPLLITNAETYSLTEKCIKVLGAHSGDRLLENGSTVSDSTLSGHLAEFLAWSLASVSVQQQVLDGMHNTPAPELQDTDVVRSAHWAARIFAKQLLPRLTDLLPRRTIVAHRCDIHTICRILLAWNLNCHAVGNRSVCMHVSAAAGVTVFRSHTAPCIVM